jgi:aquaporin Z
VIEALRTHWPEYLIEAFGLGVFMIAACLVTALVEHPISPVRAAIPSGALRRVLIGVAMGLTAIAIIYSPWGKQSGAHINPAVTLTFFRLGRVAPWDAAFYVLAQFAGGALGVALSYALFPAAVKHPAVNFVVTVPGPTGIRAAVAGEAIISFFLMLTVLAMSASRFAPYTGVVAGCLVATYIAIEAPYSGMSMNPARTVASSVVARDWTASWVYFVAPIAAMLLAGEVYRSAAGFAGVACAKLHHGADVRCIFCGFVPHS